MRTWSCLLVLACVAACGGKSEGLDAGVPDAGAVDAGGRNGGSGDAGTSTYSDGGSTSAFWDGGACTVKTDCPCFSSDDCGPGFLCHSEDSTGVHVYCVPGTRGAGAPGASCTGEADCFSALCVDSSAAGMTCSGLCTTGADCPPELPTCRHVGFGVERSLCAP